MKATFSCQFYFLTIFKVEIIQIYGALTAAALRALPANDARELACVRLNGRFDRSRCLESGPWIQAWKALDSKIHEVFRFFYDSEFAQSLLANLSEIYDQLSRRPRPVLCTMRFTSVASSS